MSKSAKLNAEQQKKCQQEIKESEKDKARYQEAIEDYQGGIAYWQAELKSYTTEEWWRRNCESAVLDWESSLQEAKQQQASCDHALQVQQSQLAQLEQENAACSSVENRDQFDQAKKEDVVQKTNSGALFGFAGTGKSHLLAALFDELPPSKRVSTAIAQTPVRAIGLVRVAVEDLSKLGITPGEILKFTRVSDDNFSLMFLKSAKKGVSRCKPTGIKKFIRALVHKPADPTDDVEKDLITKFHHLQADVQSLEEQVVIEMSDCGGQPQFLEILPRFIENISLAIVVTDLSQRLDEHPMNFYYNEQGESVGEGVRYPLTNEQVLRLCLRMVASQAHEGFRVAIVGTHRDLEGNCTQSRQEKNRLLKEMVESFGLGKYVVYRNRDELIFGVNVKDPEDQDLHTVEDLRRLLLDESFTRVVSIPVSYHGVELTLKEKVKESGHIAFLESEVLKEVSHYYLTEESLKDALRYLHKNKRIFYFEKEFPGRVIGEPQTILNKHTEVVAYHIELTTNPSRQLPLDGMWKRFGECGILNIDCLKKFPAHYVEGVFTPADMMKLFEKLLIVSEVSDGEFLMPSVLPVIPQANCNPEPETQSVAPMVLHFPGGTARYGVFCGTICYVMTESKWKLFKNTEGEQSFHISRNSVHFSVPGYRGKVTINDPLDSFFLVTIHLPTDVPSYTKKLSHMCVKVRDTLVSAINDVTEKLNYNADRPQPAFLCEEHMATSLHAATVSEFGDELLCTKCDDVKGGTVTPRHMIWLKGAPYYSPPSESSFLPPSLLPSLDSASLHLPSHPPLSADLSRTLSSSVPGVPLTLMTLHLLKWRDLQGQEQTFRLGNRVAAKWRDFGIRLGLTMNQLDSWDEQYRGNASTCWNKLMENWLNGEGSRDYPPTWEGLYSLLNDLQLSSVAAKLKKAVDSLS